MTLGMLEMPSHNHNAAGTLIASSASGTEDDPTGNVPAVVAEGGRGGDTYNGYASTANAEMATGGVTISMGLTGGGQPHTNMQPWLAVYYIICLQGVFPSRN